ncbi:hypothetical protein [Dokdonella soli]|uniref:Right-handed parallel beta-helix repeat-containing protein n=1 Tax=Dokdonella soli TaxID=529810 RepID=A0ABP3U503_9GAMM
MNTNTPDAGALNTKLMIELVGADTGFSINGFTYARCGAPTIAITVQGVAMHGFSDAIVGGGLSTPKAQINIYGCFLGTKIDGTSLPTLGNTGAAIRVDNDNVQIGGIQPWQRNLLSGNSTGVLAGSPNSTVIVEGNLIGTDATGALAIPNGTNSNWPGLLLNANFPGLRIGCTGAGCTAPGHPSRNVISGNHNVGLGIWDGPAQGTGGIQIKGNYIGTDWSGTQPLPNGDAVGGCPTYCAGIQLTGSSSVATPASIIGGSNPGEANLIAFNNGAGIISSPQYNANGAIGASFDSIIFNNGFDGCPVLF